MSLWAEIKVDEEVCRDKTEVEACQTSRSDPSLSPQPFPCNLVELLYIGLGSLSQGLPDQTSQPLHQGAVKAVAEITIHTAKRENVPTSYITSIQEEDH